MQQVLINMTKRGAAIAAGLLLLMIVSTTHTVVRPMPVAAMGGMEHHVSMSTTCATLCSTTAVSHTDKIRHAEEEKDDEPQPASFTAVFDRAYFESLYSLDYDKWPPPAKIPIYKLNGVLRS